MKFDELIPTGTSKTLLASIASAFGLKGDSNWEKEKSDTHQFPVWNSGVKETGWHKEFNHPGQVIFFTGIGAGAGHFEWIEEPLYGGPLSSFVKVNSDLVDPKYLCFYIQSTDRSTYRLGQSQPFFDWKRFSKIQIPTPSLEIQKKIVDILDAHSELAELQEERVRLLKLQKDVLLEKIFAPGKGFKFSLGGKTIDPSSWKESALGDLGVFSKGSDFGKQDLSPEGEYRAIIPGGLFRLHSANVIAKSRSNGKTKFVFATGKEILWAGDDVTKYGLFTSYAVPEAGALIAGNIFTPTTEVLDPFFGVYAIRAQGSQLARMIRGSTVHHIYARDLTNLRIKIPSLQDQQLISEYFREIDSRIKLEEERLQLLKIQNAVVLETIFKN